MRGVQRRASQGIVISKSSFWKSKLFRYGAPLFLILLWMSSPSYRHATKVELAKGDDVKTYGSVDIHAKHRIGLVAGSVHQQGCLKDGISLPTAETANVLSPLVAALREQGMDVTIMEPGAMAVPNKDPKAAALGVVLTRDCVKIRKFETWETDEAWAEMAYPAVPVLTLGMTAIPFDGVLVVNATGGAQPYSNGTLLFGSVAPASAEYEIVAQWISKDGSVPWAAEARAEGHLRHPGIHFPLSGQSGPAPKLEPVRDAAIARMAALLK